MYTSIPHCNCNCIYIAKDRKNKEGEGNLHQFFVLFRTRNNARVLGENFREYRFRIFAKITCKNIRKSGNLRKFTLKLPEIFGEHFRKNNKCWLFLKLLNLSARNHFCENIEMTYSSCRFSQEFLFQEIFAEICLRQEQMRVAAWNWRFCTK